MSSGLLPKNAVVCSTANTDGEGSVIDLGSKFDDFTKIQVTLIMFIQD